MWHVICRSSIYKCNFVLFEEMKLRIFPRKKKRKKYSLVYLVVVEDVVEGVIVINLTLPPG
jgi:hypothetical protein